MSVLHGMTNMWFLALALTLQPTSSEVGRLLKEADKASDVRGRKLLAQVVRELRTRDVPAADRDEAVRQLASLLARQARTPEEVLEVIGSDAARSIARQVLFRRY